LEGLEAEAASKFGFASKNTLAADKPAAGLSSFREAAARLHREGQAEVSRKGNAALGLLFQTCMCVM